jgi:uncharacterized protein YkwD
MNRNVLFSFLSLIALIATPAVGRTTLTDALETTPAVLSAAAYRDELQIFDGVNAQRNRSRLGDLEWDDRLAEVARAYSAKMAREHFFDHWDRNGNSVLERVQNAHIRGWRGLGENLFMCQGVRGGLSEFAVSGWMKSPSHRQNILNRNWTATGVGIAKSRDGSIYITQVFLQN